MSSKPAYSVSKLVEVRVVDFFGGLNLNKHTAVSFKEKGPTDGIHLERCSVHNSGTKLKAKVNLRAKSVKLKMNWADMR
ncbi:hypothetical protein V6Z12_A05G215100 [Gossypium hirsutum]